MTMTLIHLVNKLAQMCRDLCGVLGRAQRPEQASLLLAGWARLCPAAGTSSEGRSPKH